MAAKIKKGDKVVVLAGPRQGPHRRGDRGAPERGARAGARRQHGQAPPEARRAQQEGGIISKEAPIHLSNLALADPKDGKPTRVGFKILGDDGKKVRVAKRSGVEIDG